MSAPISIDNIVKYYVGLLIIQYKAKPKATATIALNANVLAIDNIQFSVEGGYDLNSAVGKQLDILGQYIGVNRSYQGQDFPDNLFGYLPYGQDISGSGQQGYVSYGQSKAGGVLTYSDIISNDQLLDDEDYRLLLIIKVISNSSRATHKEIDNLLYNFFGTDIIASSSGNMDLIYFIESSKSLLVSVILQKNVLPDPMGVFIYAIMKYDSPYFSYAKYGESINSIQNDILREGYVSYGQSKAGRTLNYSDIIRV